MATVGRYRLPTIVTLALWLTSNIAFNIDCADTFDICNTLDMHIDSISLILKISSKDITIENAIIMIHIFIIVLKDEFMASITMLLDIFTSTLEVSFLGTLYLKFNIKASIKFASILDIYTIKDTFKPPPIVPSIKANPPE